MLQRAFLRGVFALALVLAPGASAAAQTATPPTAPDGVSAVLVNLQQALGTSDEPRFRALFAATVPTARLEQHARDLVRPGVVSAVVRERSRAPAEGVPPGEGFLLVVEMFLATPGRGRIITASLDVRRVPNDAVPWQIADLEGFSSVEALYKLRLVANKRYTARNLTVTSEDLTIVLDEGDVFLIECDDGVTGMVLLGRGEMRFAPAPPTEQGQLKIFSGAETLTAAFDSAYLRLNPGDYRRRVSIAALSDASPDARAARRAQEIFARESPKSFAVDLQDMSPDTWHLLPPADDFLAEVDTRRHDVLTYSRASVQAEDVSLFQRKQRRTITLYPSAAKIAARGRFYTDDVLRDFDVLDYDVDVRLDPGRRTIRGRTRLAIRVRSTSLSSLMLRLAEPLAVASVTSVEYGPLLHLRVTGQNSILINLPRVAAQDSDLTLIVSYAGPVEPQELDVDTVQVGRDPQGPEPFGSAVEPTMLLSNRSFWYPQNPISDYATGTIRCSVPDGYRCAASGRPVAASDVVRLRDVLDGVVTGKVQVFRAEQPVRYLAVLVGRLALVAERSIQIDRTRAESDIERVAVAIEATPRQQARGRQLAGQVEDIMRFYSSLVGEAPYTALTTAFIESELPGGHSPAYFVVLNDPIPNPNVNWRGDPASFDNFPEFFMAHEVAHQWWGQAIGWKNYHEQWLSEGFSQYFAALYAQRARGDRVFNDMIRQFRRWTLEDSDQGPVHLGYRLGHIKSDLRVYRALVYNKGAGVLHMLRRYMGDELFFRALNRFYSDRRFLKAGTDDLERVFEAESGLVLDRFFERWIYGATLPQVTYTATTGPAGATIRFEQAGDLFDIPVTVTLVYADGQSKDVVVLVKEAAEEHVIPGEGPVRQVLVNRDWAAMAEFDAK
jgi:hypothetical protein